MSEELRSALVLLLEGKRCVEVELEETLIEDLPEPDWERARSHAALRAPSRGNRLKVSCTTPLAFIEEGEVVAREVDELHPALHLPCRRKEEPPAPHFDFQHRRLHDAARAHLDRVLYRGRRGRNEAPLAALLRRGALWRRGEY